MTAQQLPTFLLMNGDLVPYGDARVHIQTTAFKYGAVVFEGLRAYWNPDQAPGATVTTQVDYFVIRRLNFTREPRGDWIAISFDGFWPPERDSADLIARLGECDARCP